MAAVDQLGIAETVVNTVFIGLVAMVVLAAGLAFGLAASRRRSDHSELVASVARRSQDHGCPTPRASSPSGKLGVASEPSQKTGPSTAAPAPRTEPTEG